VEGTNGGKTTGVNASLFFRKRATPKQNNQVRKKSRDSCSSSKREPRDSGAVGTTKWGGQSIPVANSLKKILGEGRK